MRLTSPRAITAVFNRTATPETHRSLQQLLTGNWALSSTGTGIQRTYEFRGFNGAMKFWNRVADECKTRNHHPEWANVYNTIEIRWTTHVPKGVGHIDVEMAQFCDRVAEEVGMKKTATPTPTDTSARTEPESNNKIVQNTGVLDAMIKPGTDCEACTKGGPGRG